MCLWWWIDNTKSNKWSLLSRWLQSSESDVTLRIILISCPLCIILTPVSRTGNSRVSFSSPFALSASLLSPERWNGKHTPLLFIFSQSWKCNRPRSRLTILCCQIKRTLWISEIIACNLPLMGLSVITGCLNQPYQWQGRGVCWNEMSIILA